MVQKTLNYITKSLAKGDKVELRNFGVRSAMASITAKRLCP